MAAAATSDLLEQARSLEVDLGLDIDLVDLMTVPTVLRYEVITRGRRIYCAERDVAVEFEGRSLAEHGRFMEDFAPLFDKIRETGRAIGRDLDDLLEFSQRVGRIE